MGEVNRDAIAIAVGVCLLGVVIALGVVSSSAERPRMVAVEAGVDAAGAPPTASAHDPSAQPEFSRDDYRRALFEAGLDPRIADAPIPARGPDTHGDVRTRKARITTATHLFDSKESVKRASAAAGRRGGAGYLQEASLHGTLVESGESVVILYRGLEYAEVLAPRLGIRGWTLVSLLEGAR